MATTTELKTQLAKVHTAIEEILDTGHSVSADGRSLTMVDIDKLREHADWLEGKIAARSGRGRNRIIEVTPNV